MKFIATSFTAAVTVFLLSCLCAATVNAADLNGISVSENSIKPGSEFTVTITVPPSENADTAGVRVSYDEETFDVIEWSPVVPGGISNAAKGMLVLMAANVDRFIDLSGGLTLTARMKAKDSAAAGEYTFELTEHSLCYVNDDGFNFTELWEPETLSASVTITGGAVTSAAEQAAETASVTSAAVTDAPSAEPLRGMDEVKVEGPNVTVIIVIVAAALAAAVIVIAVILKIRKKSE